jgi:hypothetical protein
VAIRKRRNQHGGEMAALSSASKINGVSGENNQWRNNNEKKI